MERLIPDSRLRELLGGCSQMHLWRLRNKYRLLPQPIKSNGRNSGINLNREADVQALLDKLAGNRGEPQAA